MAKVGSLQFESEWELENKKAKVNVFKEKASYI